MRILKWLKWLAGVGVGRLLLISVLEPSKVRGFVTTQSQKYLGFPFFNWFLKTIYLLIYLAVPGLSCSTWDLRSSLWSWTFSCSMWTVSYDMWDRVPWPGIQPRPLHWEHRVLATGPPGKSLTDFLNHLNKYLIDLQLLRLLYFVFSSCFMSHVAYQISPGLRGYDGEGDLYYIVFISFHLHRALEFQIYYRIWCSQYL